MPIDRSIPLPIHEPAKTVMQKVAEMKKLGAARDANCTSTIFAFLEGEIAKWREIAAEERCKVIILLEEWGGERTLIARQDLSKYRAQAAKELGIQINQEDNQ